MHLPSQVTQRQTAVSHAPAAFTRQARARMVIIFLVIMLISACLAGVGLGAVHIAPTQVVAILMAKLGLPIDATFTAQQSAVLLAIRLPRVILGMLVGAALAVSGTAVQGLFRNPLASPGLVGISSGAALAAVSVIVLGGTWLSGISVVLGHYALPMAAFVGGAATTFIIYRVSQVRGRTSVATMLLAGIAINALAGAVVGLLTFVASDEQLRDITFWSLGSLGGATWKSISVAAPLIVLPLLFMPALAQALNSLLLGEAEAKHLGVHVEKTKRLVVVWVALAVGTAVALTGVIGFVGLVVPHLLRLIIGPDHRYILPGSALLGASLLLVADLAARTIVVPAELPIGIVTAFIGAPFFLWLLLRHRQHGGF